MFFLRSPTLNYILQDRVCEQPIIAERTSKDLQLDPRIQAQGGLTFFTNQLRIIIWKLEFFFSHCWHEVWTLRKFWDLRRVCEYLDLDFELGGEGILEGLTLSISTTPKYFDQPRLF